VPSGGRKVRMLLIWKGQGKRDGLNWLMAQGVTIIAGTLGVF